MGHRQSLMTPERQLRAQRAQQMSLIYTVMVCLVSLIFVQFLLLTVALEGYLGGRIEVALPTALVSGLCCAAAYWLLGIFSCRVGADHRHPNPPYRGGWDALTPTVIHAQEPERGTCKGYWTSAPVKGLALRTGTDAGT